MSARILIEVICMMLCATILPTGQFGSVSGIPDPLPQPPTATQQQAPSSTNVFDEYGALTPKQARSLNSMAASISEKYGVGVYLLYTDSMGPDYPTPEQRNSFAQSYYVDNGLGTGPDKEGILFVVAVDTRDYVTIWKGAGGNPLGHADAEAIEDAVLPYLAENCWARGGREYLSQVEIRLANYEPDETPRRDAG